MERHQTLRAAVDWSYSLLSTTERTVFDRLGVFAGPFDLVAATNVVTGDGVETWDVVDAIGEPGREVDAHERRRDRRQHPLPTARDDAAVRARPARRTRAKPKADADGTPSTTPVRPKTRAAACAAPTSCSGDREWRPISTTSAPRSRGRSISAAEADHELALRIVAAFAGEANASASSFGVGLWAERALDAARATTKPELRADVVGAVAWSVFVRGDIDRARAFALEALMDGVSPNMWAPSNPYVLLGYLDVVLGQIRRGNRAHRRRLRRGRGADGRSPLRPCDGIGEPRRVPGVRLRPRQATNEGEAVLRMARELANPSVLSNALTIRVVSTWIDDPDIAEPWLDEAIALARSGASGVMFGIMLAIRAHLRLDAADMVRARNALREAVAYLGSTGDLPQLVTVFEYAIPVLVSSGSPGPATVLAGFALDGPFSPLGNMPEEVVPRRDAALERACSELGEERFRIEREHGAGMSPEEAVAHVLKTIDELEVQQPMPE